MPRNDIPSAGADLVAFLNFGISRRLPGLMGATKGAALVAGTCQPISFMRVIRRKTRSIGPSGTPHSPDRQRHDQGGGHGNGDDNRGHTAIARPSSGPAFVVFQGPRVSLGSSGFIRDLNISVRCRHGTAIRTIRQTRWPRECNKMPSAPIPITEPSAPSPHGSRPPLPAPRECALGQTAAAATHARGPCRNACRVRPRDQFR